MGLRRSQLGVLYPVPRFAFPTFECIVIPYATFHESIKNVQKKSTSPAESSNDSWIRSTRKFSENKGEIEYILLDLVSAASVLLFRPSPAFRRTHHSFISNLSKREVNS